MIEHLTDKQKLFMKDVINGHLKRINILEGSVRSGKTYASIIAWVILLSNYIGRSNFLMVGKTITSLKRNCLSILEEILPPESFSYSLSKKEAYIFENKVFLEGVNDSRSEQKIRGMTLQYAYCDEITLFTEDFFSMLLSRLSLKGSCLIGTTNPDAPSHWLMKKYISRSQDLNLKVWKFLLEDNNTIPEEIINDMKKEYTGVFYDRFILGNWVEAEGLIYQDFADNKSEFIIDYISPVDLDIVQIGIDYGASKSRTAFIAIGLYKNMSNLVVLKEKTCLGVKTPEQMYDKFIEFYNDLVKEYGYISSCFADWGGLGQVLTKGLQSYCFKQSINIKVNDCKKIKIIERINIIIRLMSMRRFKILRRCNETIEALCSSVWDTSKEDTRLDDGTTNIDVIDAMEYAISNKYSILNSHLTLNEVEEKMNII